MKEIQLKTELHRFARFKDFAAEFRLGPKDLILTHEVLYANFMKGCTEDCRLIFQESFGAGEPTSEMIEIIWDAAESTEFKRVVAVGGGAVLDIGKVLALRRQGSVVDLFSKKLEIARDKELIAIPATCGTGSEVTNISVAIVQDEYGEFTKLGLVSDLLLPDVAAVIPELLTTLPFRPFAAAVIDALIHAVESFLSPWKATLTSELFSVRAIELILTGINHIAKEGPKARFAYLEEFLLASCYAGIAFLQAGCATVHAMSFPLGGKFQVPHGEANYALFDKVLEKYNRISPDGKIARIRQIIAQTLDCDEADALQSLARLETVLLSPRRLSEYGMQDEDAEHFADSVMGLQQRLLVNSYVPMTRELLVTIYRECL